MGTIMKLYGPGDVRYDEYEDRKLLPFEVRIKTLFSGISAGTELSHFRGTNPARSKKWDEKSRLFITDDPLDYYPRGTGYEEVGEVIEVGTEVKDIGNGDIVYGAWTHKSTHIMDEKLALLRKLPIDLEPICGIFAQIGAIALNGILDAQINVSETVVIFGQGTVGLICTQLAKLSGARVIVVDFHERRLELSRKSGADIVINAKDIDVGEAIKDYTNGLGADVSLEASGSVAALCDSIKGSAYSGKVIALGFYQEEAAGLFLGEEFHHNRISIVCSQIGGINPILQYRWNRVRLDNTVMELQRMKKLNLKQLISHIVDFKEAPNMYKIISENPADVSQAVLRF